MGRKRKGWTYGKKEDIGTRMYNIWRQGMIQRCYNPNHVGYESYGGRGIEICEEWKDYANFKEWSLNNGYDDTLTIDRIDNDGNYSPDNCRWVTMQVQLRNTRKTKRLTVDGVTKSIIDWRDETGITNLANRMKWGVPDELILDDNLDEGYWYRKWLRGIHGDDRINVTYKGETKTLVEWCEELDLHYQTVFNRMTVGIPEDELFDFTKKRKHRKNVKVELNGESRTIREWADMYGINYMTLYRRIIDGFPAEMVLYKGNIKKECQDKVNEAIGRPKDRKPTGVWNAVEDDDDKQTMKY